eukprot:9274801-Heterocapsa_arctica.AAC.1
MAEAGPMYWMEGFARSKRRAEDAEPNLRTPKAKPARPPPHHGSEAWPGGSRGTGGAGCRIQPGEGSGAWQEGGQGRRQKPRILRADRQRRALPGRQQQACP